MKRCPKCRRDYYDDSLLYCLEDGAALVQGSVPSPDEPATAILSESQPVGIAGGQFSESATRPQIHATEAEPCKVDPYMDPLRDDPRFKDVLRRAGFPE